MRLIIDHDARSEIVVPRPGRRDPEVETINQALGEVDGLLGELEQIAPELRPRVERACRALEILGRRLRLRFEGEPPSVPAPGADA